MKTSVYLIIKEIQQNPFCQDAHLLMDFIYSLLRYLLSAAKSSIYFNLLSWIKTCQCQSTYEDSLEMLFHGSCSGNKMSSIMELSEGVTLFGRWDIWKTTIELNV